MTVTGELKPELAKEFLKLHFNLKLDDEWVIDYAFICEGSIVIVVKDNWQYSNFLFELYLSTMDFESRRIKVI